jgi:hypothetical protein
MESCTLRRVFVGSLVVYYTVGGSAATKQSSWSLGARATKLDPFHSKEATTYVQKPCQPNKDFFLVCWLPTAKHDIMYSSYDVVTTL